jgi:hypothetical protein
MNLETEDEYPVPAPVELLRAVSVLCNGQKLDDITTVLIIMASRTLVMQADNIPDLIAAVLEFATGVSDATQDLAEQIGLGEPRQ